MRGICLSALLVSLAAGCGGSPSEQPVAADTPPAEAPVVARPPQQPLKVATVSERIPVTPTFTPDEGQAVLPEPADGSPESLIKEVIRLAAATLTSESGAKAVGLDAGADALTPIADSAVAAADRKRQADIVQLSMEVLVQTKDDPAKRQLFGNAVHYLTAAQARLALAGDADAERQLLETADSLRRRDARSFAAAEASAKVVELARLKAERDGTPELAAAYARQARFFAAEFAHDANRAAVTLLQAGRWCEDRGHFRGAAACYGAVAADFPESLFAAPAAGSARRAALVGEPLAEFGGPTIDGGYVRPEHYRGRPMAIVFWSPTDGTVPELFADLDAARRANPKLALIGVCLSEDSRMATAAVEVLPTCPQIYGDKPSERGFTNPLARHYGIDKTPSLWLIDSAGVVRTVAGKATEAKELL